MRNLYPSNVDTYQHPTLVNIDRWPNIGMTTRNVQPKAPEYGQLSVNFGTNKPGFRIPVNTGQTRPRPKLDLKKPRKLEKLVNRE